MGLSFPGSRAVTEQPAPCGHRRPSCAGCCPGLYWNSAAVSTSSKGDPLIRSVARTGGLPCWLGLLLYWGAPVWDAWPFGRPSAQSLPLPLSLPPPCSLCHRATCAVSPTSALKWLRFRGVPYSRSSPQASDVGATPCHTQVAGQCPPPGPARVFGLQAGIPVVSVPSWELPTYDLNWPRDADARQRPRKREAALMGRGQAS